MDDWWNEPIWMRCSQRWSSLRVHTDPLCPGAYNSACAAVYTQTVVATREIFGVDFGCGELFDLIETQSFQKLLQFFGSEEQAKRFAGTGDAAGERIEGEAFKKRKRRTGNGVVEDHAAAFGKFPEEAKGVCGGFFCKIRHHA